MSANEIKKWKDGSLRHGRRKVIAVIPGQGVYAYVSTGRMVVGIKS